MNTTDNNFYDRYYYLTSCGIRYDDTEKWGLFFGEIADRIVHDINPKTVMDAGCAYGYLVAALRDRGVEAYGIDISEYAISQVREDIKPFCSVGSVLDPLPAKYDLIISIEVMEHLRPGECRSAIENLCRYTDDFLFTSTPTDFKEATHFNVQPTEYWIALFADNSFYRDVNFDASFIISHAIRLKRLKEPVSAIIGGYEKSFYRYFNENITLRDELVATRAVIAQRFIENESPLLAEKNQIIHDKDIHIMNLDKFVQDRDKYIASQGEIAIEREQAISNLNTLIHQKEKELREFKDRLHQLDVEHLKYVDEKTHGLYQIIREKDEYFIRLQEDHITQLNSLHDKNKGLGQVEKNIAQLIEYIDKEVQQNGMREDDIQELTDINMDLKGRMRNLYLLLEEKEKMIQALRMESDNLKLESRGLKSSYESILVPYKSAHLELERIRKLKGHKILWKYYEIRDRIFSRNRANGTSSGSSVLKIESGSQAAPVINVMEGETILEKERKYYSKNPIYNIDFGVSPLISIVVPVFNTPVDVLKEMIQSVISQTYPNWELYLLDAGADSQAQAACIHAFMAADRRILYKKIENKGIAANTNAGVEMAKGEFIAFLDHDDTITPNALFEVVARLQEDENAYDFFYSDKDMMLEDGRVSCNPLYKPRWSPEIMFSANYLTHFCVIRKKLIEASGLLDSRTDGAQDWDIFLKVSRLTNKICHIPAKLYHWRIIQTSVASGIGAKPYALKAQLLALQNHFDALNYNATVKFQDEERSIIKVDWHNTGVRLVSFIVNHNGTAGQLQALLEQLSRFSTSYKCPVEAIVLTKDKLSPDFAHLIKNVKIVDHRSDNIYEEINRVAKEEIGDILVMVNSQIIFDDIESINELINWAAQKQYGVISPQLKNYQDTILSAGIVINGNYILNIFNQVASKHYTVFGHTEWYRNITAAHLECFAVKTSLVRDNGYFQEDYNEFACIEFCLKLLKGGYRHVYNPFAKIKIRDLADLNETGGVKNLVRLREKYDLKDCDPYWNSNLLSNHGVPSENKRKTNIIPEKKELQAVITGWEKYSADAFYLAHEFDFSNDDFTKNFDIINSNKGELDVKSVNWILPHFDFLYYAGLYTIFRFANYLQSIEGVQNTIVTVGGNNEKEVYNTIIEAFPLMRGCKVICLADSSEIRKIPYADASICSLWTTAYYLLRFQNTKRKFYFIQDFEPLFYPAGSTYGQTEATYKFGFYGITNTQGLRKIYEEQYNGKAIDLKPCIDGNVFHTGNGGLRKGNVSRVFFYSRPGHPRNGFELGSTALKILKNRLKDKVEIYCAGSDWDPADYDLAGVVNNMGRMDFEKTADLYRICDVGLVMMFTKHPSYLPFELMACGCTVVSNHNKDTTWFLKDGFNCLLTEASATRIAETIEKLLSDEGLRSKLSRNAADNIRENHAEWNTELSSIYRFMCSPDKAE